MDSMTKYLQKMKGIYFTIKPEEYKDFEKIAKKLNVSKTELLRIMIEAFK